MENYLKGIAHLRRVDSIFKLHVGCGPNILQGWLNVDLFMKPGVSVLVDASSPLPFNGDSFRYIFSEHFIEHLEYAQAARFIAECFRVLMPGGKIRIATPDLSFLMQLYGREKTELQERYIRWASETFLPDAPMARDTFVINNFFYAWGHKFIHDEESLTLLLKMEGFVEACRVNLWESEDVTLRHLESHGRWISDEFNKLETFVMEAIKPAPGSLSDEGL